MEEIWKDIKGCEGSYMVSNLGRVKSLERKVNSRYGKHHTIREKILKQSLDGCGYCIVNVGKTNTVHTLVYEAFVGTIPKGYTVNHIDENKQNNCVLNLNLMTRGENDNWGSRNERIAKSLSKPVAQYTKDGIFIREFESATVASKLTGADRVTICNCCNNKSKTAGGYIWKFV